MANFLKVIIFLAIVAGIGIYFFSHSSELFKGTPQEKIISAPSTKYVAPSGPNAPLGSNMTAPSTISSQSSQISDSQIPSGFTRGQLSSYFHKITISSAYTSSYSSYPSEIKLYSSLSKDEKINITGWRIKSNRGEIIIPKAVNVYEPSGFSPEEDIVLSANNYVNIYGNNSPISRNLRLNKCTGYLQNTYNFNPALPQNCPSISNSEISYLSGQCQTYISSLWGCKLPDVSFYNLLPGTNEGNTCRAFLNAINSAFCFQKHRSDSDFLSNEWRIWVNQNILDSQHDKVLLYDKQGLLVDQYIY